MYLISHKKQCFLTNFITFVFLNNKQEGVCPVSLVGIPSKHLSLIPLAARDKGRDTKYPLAERKALFYANKGRDTNSFAYKRKELFS